ncbi:zinc finger, RING/FYVE/PHD-type containing protein [Tanacetum coccineum]
MIKEVGRSVEIHDVIDREEEESDETKLEFDEEDIMELKLEFDEDDKGDDDDDVEESEKVEDMKFGLLRMGKTSLMFDGVCLKIEKFSALLKTSCLPCGHIFGMSCILNWLRKFTNAHGSCLRCNTLFALKDVRILYVNHLCIPTADDQKEDTRRFPYSKQGYTAFKQYIRGRLTHALNNRKTGQGIGTPAYAIGRADALRRAGALGLRADALGQRADKRLQKADEFWRQGKGLRRQAKAFCRQVDACKASLMFFKQSYKELHGFAS